jgi:hypothetical protein
MPVYYDDEVTAEQVRQLKELVREEFEHGDWIAVEYEC